MKKFLSGKIVLLVQMANNLVVIVVMKNFRREEMEQIDSRETEREKED